ncbi:CHAT domain-containing protein [Paucibacter sp. DJ2R-2]|uniref:CHAT domain-containing protein n=1 Tax=Paucibacter sp. DJ2R-2 TaxID=2893558 RepID=UPI0021E4B257|nr:CHAT domain-containing protein [Paucibacter sp. DJ2R-2]MCV2420032.1 CHAT domain-containing protein [Paucibacter sp. DJ4R-1]MCV2437041.1 CHAT domain-containing protein [Paucibacter sp. DJ2R-2]
MRLRLLSGGWLLAAGLTALPAWSDPIHERLGGADARQALALLCDAAPAAVEASLPLLEQLLREPEQALARICARPPSEPAALAVALQQARMAWQLLERPFSDPLGRSLAALEPAAGLAVFAEARVWFLMLAARAALDRAARDEAVPLVAEALPLALALPTGGADRDVMWAQLRVLEITASWRRQAPGWVERSEASLSEAAALLQGQGLAVSALMGEVLNLRTVVSHAQDRLAVAVGYAEQEAELLRQMGRGESPDMLDALASLAAIYGQMELMDRSQQALEDALRIIERHPDANPSAQLGVFHNLASNYLHYARVDEALALALRAVALAETTFGANSPRLLPYRVSLLNLRMTQGQLGEALAVSEAIDAMLGPDSAGTVGLARLIRARHLQSVLWQKLGQARRARELLAPLLSLSEGRSDLGYWRSRLLLSHAAVQMQLGQPGLAYRDYDAAMQALRQIVGDTPSLLLEAYGGRCRAAVAQPGATQAPLPACEELQQFLDQHPDYAGLPPADRARAHKVLAQWKDSRSAWAAGLDHHLRGLAAAESHAAPLPLWDNLHGLARHWAQRGREDLALQLGRQSLDQIELMRQDLRGKRPGQERGFVQELSSVYRDQAAWLARSGRIAEAQDVLRDWSAVELDEFSDGQLRVRRSARLRAPEALLQQSPSAAGPERVGAERMPSLGSAGEVLSPRRLAQAQLHWRAQRENEALKLQQWQQWLQQALLATAPKPSSAAQRLQATAKQRPSRGVLEVWSISGQERLSLLMIHAGGQSQLELAWPARQLGQELAELLRKIEAREPVDAELRHWFRRLGEPLLRAARRAKAGQVEVYLDGALRYLPLGLLRGPEGYLGQSVRLVQRLPEGGGGEVGAGQAGLSALRLRAFGSSQAVAGLPALPAVVQEICELVAGPIEGLGSSACLSGPGLWRGQGWLDASFTQRTLQDELQLAAQARAGGLLHLGTHFTLRPGVMSRSWLRLGDGQRLHLAELARMPFTHTQLVTLSACSTGLGGGDDGSGAEVAGLNASLLQAGASEVLSSLWSVDDAATRRWMRNFYAALRRHGDSARALQSAQRAFLAQSGGQSHPFYWGAFYLARANTQR